MQSRAGGRPWWRRRRTAAAAATAAGACVLALTAGPGGGNALVVALRAEPPGRAWAGEGQAGQTAASDGARLLGAWQCGACHRIDGVPGAEGTTAPALTALARRSYIAGRLPLTPERLAQWIVDPPALLPGTAMPALGVPPGEARAMAAWLLARQ